MNNSIRLETPLSGRLAHLGLLRFSGPDAAAFLQGQVSNDTSRLAAGEPLLAAYSSPQGRVLAVLHLLPHSTGVIALLPRELISSTLERLRKYVLRAKVQIEDVSGHFAVIGRHHPSAGDRDAATADREAATADLDLPVPTGGQRYVEHGGIGIARIGTTERLFIIGSEQDLSRHGIAGGPGSPSAEQRAEQDWRLADIRAGLPQVYDATRELFVAQMLNLDLLDGISFTKGCFTGQEIIARTQHLGRIKRRMFRLQLPGGEWTIGRAVRLRDGRTGRLTELARAGLDVEALAVLTLEAAPPGASADADSAGGADSAGDIVDAGVLSLPYSVAAA
jgi:folate-binding protein YgfZ